MSKRTIGPDGLDETKQYPFESERMRISREWKQITGSMIPVRIEKLPIEEQVAALEFQRKKHQPAVPISDEPIRPWDGHKEF